MKNLKILLMACTLLLTLTCSIFFSASDKAFAATPPTLTDLWNGNAHFEMSMNRPMDGQFASGSNIVVVGGTWYWFHRNVVDVASWKLGTVVESPRIKVYYNNL